MSDATGQRGSVDAATLRALAVARWRTREMSDDLLGHLPDVGDLATQRLLDAWVEQAADALRALSEAAEERLIERGRGDATSPSVAAERPQRVTTDGRAPGPFSSGLR